MLKHVELDESFNLKQQFADTSDATTILINLFDVDPGDRQDFTAAWLTDAKFFAAQPGCISAQLHQGCVGEADGRVELHATEQPAGLQHTELDPTFSLEQQYADASGETTVLVNLFDVDPSDHDYFKAAWKADAEFFKAQPGYISAQLHQGILGSRKFLNYAVFENTAAFADTNRRPEFGPLRRVYPGSTVAHPHLFRRLSIPEICVGDATMHSA